MKILVLTFGDENTPSTRFRVVQYRELLTGSDISCTLVPARAFRDFASLGDYHTVLVQKTLLDSGTVRKLRQGARRLVYDADDRIWLAPGKTHSIFTRFRNNWRLKTIARSADLCIAANQVIADDLQRAGGVTTVIPMALDGNIWHPRLDRKETPLTIGWSGAPRNLVFLRAILPQLREVQVQFPNVRWVFHSGENPHFSDFSYEYVPFIPGNEPATVAGFHIGLLPLPEDPFVRGKSPIKGLQYCACGVAVVADPVGATRELLADGVNSLWVNGEQTWATTLSRLITDTHLLRILGTNARRTFNQQNELSTVFSKFCRALTGEQIPYEEKQNAG